MADLPDGLIPLAEARERFATTEPLASVTFLTTTEEGQDSPFVTFGPRWAALVPGEEKVAPTRPVDAWLTVPKLEQRYQLTFQAAQQIGSTCRQPKDLQVSQPVRLHQPVVNWWLGAGLGERSLKLLLAGTGKDEDGAPVPLAVAQTRGTVTPFGNLALLDRVLEVVEARFGSGAAARAGVHFTMEHDLEHTDMRLVVPDGAREIAGTAVGEDVWYPVVEVTNSCIGLKQTTVTGGLMRGATLAVVIDGIDSAGGFKRLRTTPEEAYDWAGESAGDVLDGLDFTWSGLEGLVDQQAGAQTGTFVNSLCGEFRVARAQQERLTALLEEFPGDLSMYELAALMARTGNMNGLGWRARGVLMGMSGHVVHSGGGRCTKDRPCYRAYPQNFEPSA